MQGQDDDVVGPLVLAQAGGQLGRRLHGPAGQGNLGGGIGQPLHADGDQLAPPFDQAVGVHDEGVARMRG